MLNNICLFQLLTVSRGCSLHRSMYRESAALPKSPSRSVSCCPGRVCDGCYKIQSVHHIHVIQLLLTSYNHITCSVLTNA